MVDPLLEQALACVDDFYARIFRNWPGAVTRVVGDCTLSYSGDTRLTGANHIWPQHPDALNDDVLADGAQFFAIYRAAWSVVLTDTYMPGWVERLEASGYYGRWSTPLMVLTERPLHARCNPSSRVVRATTRQHIADAGRVMSEAFASGSGVNNRIGRPEHLGSDDILHYLAYAGDEPAACATVALCGDMAGIWNVGTRTAFRRQRHATTLMIAILDELRARGIGASMLMASNAGLPLYERLGYRSLGTTIYYGPPFRLSFAGG